MAAPGATTASCCRPPAPASGWWSPPTPTWSRRCSFPAATSAAPVHGTVNDVAVMGARPLYLAASFILEEGFPLADLARIVASMAAAAGSAGVPVVTGDTKVVEKGKGRRLFITTTGIGAPPVGRQLSGANARRAMR